MIPMLRVVQVLQVTWWGRMVAAFAAIPTGLYLAWLGISLTFTVETRLDHRDEINRSAEADPARPDAYDGQFVTVSGPVRGSEPIGDPDFFGPGEYVWMFRSVETWSWIETRHTEEERAWGGGANISTTFDYERAWTTEVPDSAQFQEPEGHTNVEGEFWPELITPAHATIGGFRFDPTESILIAARPLDPAALPLVGKGASARVEEGWFYLGDPANPKIGDQRIQFVAVPAGAELTLIGDAEQGRIRGHDWYGTITLLLGFEGTREDLLTLAESEYRIRGIIERVAGWLLLWVGLYLIGGFLPVAADIIPPLGLVVRLAWLVATGVIASGLSMFLATLSAIVFNPILLGLTLFLAYIFGRSAWESRRGPANGTPPMHARPPAPTAPASAPPASGAPSAGDVPPVIE